MLIFGNALQIYPPRFHLQFEQRASQFERSHPLRIGPRSLLVVGDRGAVAAEPRNRLDGSRRIGRLEQTWRELGLLPDVFSANGDTWRR
jgi:hypothetical protein